MKPEHSQTIMLHEKSIQNPILKGFNPDPSILRVGEDYYIATSTFEWFPGVQIHHSRDLVNWRLLTRPLDRISQLNMIGNPDSGGIWAPCLSYCDGLFYLIYTDMKYWLRDPYKIGTNYLVTAPDIMGPWSEPIPLNFRGFDPSLFHDDDGKKWFVNMVWDHRQQNNRFSGILLQEYDHEQKKLVGPVKTRTPWNVEKSPWSRKRSAWLSSPMVTLAEPRWTTVPRRTINSYRRLSPRVVDVMACMRASFGERTLSILTVLLAPG